MTVPLRFIAHQGPVLTAIGRTALGAVRARAGHGARGTWSAPGPTWTVTVPPRPPALIEAYIRHVGGSPAAYRGVLPPHMFPQWGFEPLSRTLAGAPYPIDRALNGGCRYTAFEPLPADEPLTIAATLRSIDVSDTRVVLEQEVLTTTPSAPRGLDARLFAIIPIARQGRPLKKKAPQLVPVDARELAFWRLSASAGFDFAKLTGDFNPVHWIGAAARAAGFRNTILHGFATLARAVEGVQRTVYSGSPSIVSVDARFVRPLVLPARVGLYAASPAQEARQVWVGDAPGGPAYMDASMTTSRADSAT